MPAWTRKRQKKATAVISSEYIQLSTDGATVLLALNCYGAPAGIFCSNVFWYVFRNAVCFVTVEGLTSPTVIFSPLIIKTTSASTPINESGIKFSRGATDLQNGFKVGNKKMVVKYRRIEAAQW